MPDALSGQGANSPRQATPEETLQLLARLQSVLTGLAEFSNTLHELTDYLPVANSPAEADLQVGLRDAHADYAYAASGLLEAAAANHLVAASRLLQQPIPSFGLMATCRAAYENSLRAWWLYEPHIATEERAMRGLMERLYSLSEAAGVEAVMLQEQGLSEDPHSLKRAEGIRDELQASGTVVVIRERDGRFQFSVQGRHRPSATELAGDLLEEMGVVMFKYLSAAIHGTTYAHLQEYRVEESDRGGLGYIARTSNDFGMLGASIATAALSYLHAFDRQVFLYGWDATQWQAWRGHALQVLRAVIPPEGGEESC